MLFILKPWQTNQLNSDQGCHYTCFKFIQFVKDANLRQSMSRRANCWDNAPQESFYGRMKDEIDISCCEPFSEVKEVIQDWADYYNNDRYQWELAKLSPNEYYELIQTGVHPLGLKQR
jgi:putative transposase